MPDAPIQPENVHERQSGVLPEPWLGVENMVAILATVIWIVLCAVLFWSTEHLADVLQAPLLQVVLAVSAALPVAMIWVIAFTMKNARVSRGQNELLLHAVRSMREAQASQAGRDAAADPGIQRKIGELAEGQQRLEATLAQMLDAEGMTDPKAGKPTIFRRQAPQNAPLEQEESKPLTVAELIQAMNFPDTAEDMKGMAAYRRGLKDQTIGGLIRASEDILTLFSREALYMDDLTASRTRPETWRKYANGGRGQEIAELGGDIDLECLALVEGQMSQDSVFRDAAEHFLRKFDKTFSELSDHLSNQEISALADTRTARAFRLLGKVTGMFE
ncbi:MAG: hypothetical protein F4103_01090 [Boseongicola sp. SB0673_bin_14]|nr:hypothetical protein [Boseongicola sp. SB0667_bin_21]MYI67402.1 hypothetical protein [Boseongicola sp. SB0673_bin_14]